MMDYIKLGASRTGMNYILMLVDRMSRFVMFVPTKAATAVEAARAIMSWVSMLGLSEWLISEGGSHFKNELLEELADLLQIQHHITLPYCPWANGSVEVVGKDLLWTLRGICREMRLAVDECDLIATLLAYVVNHRYRQVLGGRSAIEVVTGRAPDNAVRLAIWSGAKLTDVVTYDAASAKLEEHCDELAASLERLHEEVSNRAEAESDKRCAKRNAGRACIST